MFFISGTSPGDSAVAMNAGLFNHFMKGSGYPIGGASQIAFNIIPVIERGGGKVLCNARGWYSDMYNIYSIIYTII